ncbi:MAG: translation initiation factor IF-2 [Candidatus Nealsonbacteria bacterium]|nr:translation initiation factor IF-2 [Candidatus Nealsonbacteria bacterium]
METKNKNLIAKPPVVVILGHVDSGKTSILDYIRKSHIAQKESGGITQHIGAYQIEYKGKKITFIDTPGHEAFSAMRSRGAKAADIAVLVIDSVKGVEPQTKEAIAHIKKAGIPFIVALNKGDRPDANPEKAKGMLMKEEVLVESLGGKVPAVETSVVSGKGLDEILELISLLSEVEGLKADLESPSEGWILESYQDSKIGITATLILNQGTLKTGDVIGTPSSFGKIKILRNFQGEVVERALPADPVVALGFETLPRAGENFKSFPDLESARAALQTFPEKKDILPAPAEGTEQQFLNLIVKADYTGSAEAIEGVLKEIPQEKVAIRFLKMEVGDVDESDVKLAKSSEAKIIGFRVKTSQSAKALALRDKIRIMNFEIIYDLVEGVRKFMEAKVSPDIVRRDLGRLRILEVFLTEKNRQVVGGRVQEGEIEKGVQVEVLRGEELLGKGKIINLQRNKKDAEMVKKGEECGMLFEGDVKIEKEDILAAFLIEKEKGEL